MKLQPINIFIGLFFIALILCSATIQTELKTEPQVYLIAFGVMTFASLFARGPYKTRVPFSLFLGILTGIGIFTLTNLITQTFHHDDGWITDENGVPHRVMQWNWLWGLFTAILFSPLVVYFYNKKIQRNRVLEIGFVSVFVVVTVVVLVV